MYFICKKIWIKTLYLSGGNNDQEKNYNTIRGFLWAGKLRVIFIFLFMFLCPYSFNEYIYFIITKVNSVNLSDDSFHVALVLGPYRFP